MSDLIERLKQENWENGGSDRLAMADALAVALFDGATLNHADTCLKALQGSLDAALALVAEKLPGASVQLYWVDQVIGSAEIGINRRTWLGRHKSPAIALLIALLQAVQATGETGDV